MSSIAKPVTDATAKPFLKWAGGKQALAATLASTFPRHFERYYEPFIGGGSVFLTLRPGRAVISDDNKWLIDAYLAIRDDWRHVVKILDTLGNTKTEYLAVRATDPGGLDRWNRAAHFIYLNKTCFRGLFRVNQRGEFNVPYGAYERRYYDPENLQAVAAALHEVEIRAGDFELGIDGITERDFVYFDPPYFKLGGYSDFNRYTAGRFEVKDHIRLAALCRELDHRGVRWALSNSDTAFIKELFRGYQFTAVEARREIQLDPQKRSVRELLISNYEVATAEERAPSQIALPLAERTGAAPSVDAPQRRSAG